MRRAVENYGMISRGDRIAVGVSGGKDSVVLLKLLAELRRFDAFSFDLEAISIDPSFEDIGGGRFDRETIGAMCEELGVRLTVVKTKIARIVFEARGEERPCSLCARLRRGALNDEAEKLGCSTLALGHHMDDAAETFMMNLMIGGKIGCFSPVTEYERIRLIRPLIYMREREIEPLRRALSLPVLQKICPVDGGTERERMKKTLISLDREYRGLYDSIIGAMERGEVDGWKRGTE
ncbi:MAG: tRNA 2-thiocytidine biosynthesis protein TtcA [Clostridia bacterium]|nr:tRNA 2-thiocytidine biosynthesis protein TtcA [Clostridia bacterium]